MKDKNILKDNKIKCSRADIKRVIVNVNTSNDLKTLDNVTTQLLNAGDSNARGTVQQALQRLTSGELDTLTNDLKTSNNGSTRTDLICNALFKDFLMPINNTIDTHKAGIESIQSVFTFPRAYI